MVCPETKGEGIFVQGWKWQCQPHLLVLWCAESREREAFLQKAAREVLEECQALIKAKK